MAATKNLEPPKHFALRTIRWQWPGAQAVALASRKTLKRKVLCSFSTPVRFRSHMIIIPFVGFAHGVIFSNAAQPDSIVEVWAADANLFFICVNSKITCDLSKEASFCFEMEKIAQWLKPRIELYHGCTETSIDEFPSWRNLRRKWALKMVEYESVFGDPKFDSNIGYV